MTYRVRVNGVSVVVEAGCQDAALIAFGQECGAIDPDDIEPDDIEIEWHDEHVGMDLGMEFGIAPGPAGFRARRLRGLA